MLVENRNVGGYAIRRPRSEERARLCRDPSYIKNGNCTQQTLYKSLIWRVRMEEPNNGLLCSRFLDDLMEPAYEPESTRNHPVYTVIIIGILSYACQKSKGSGLQAQLGLWMYSMRVKRSVLQVLHKFAILYFPRSPRRQHMSISKTELDF